MPLHLSWQPEEAHREVSRARSLLLPRGATRRRTHSDRNLQLRGEKGVPTRAREVGLFIFLVKCGQSLILARKTLTLLRVNTRDAPAASTAPGAQPQPQPQPPHATPYPCHLPTPAVYYPPSLRHPLLKYTLGVALPPATLLRILFLCHGDGLDQRVHLHHVCDEPPAPGVGVGEGPRQALGRVRGRVTG